jgi:hypothetical protein
VSPKEVFDKIIKEFDITSCSDIDLVIEIAIKQLHPEMNEFTILEIASSIKGSIINYINEYIKSYDRKDVPPKITWSRNDSEILVGRAFVGRVESSEVAESKKILALLEPIQMALATRLSFSDFEHLCCILLSEAGFVESKVKGRSHNGGIDVHAKLRFEEYPMMRVELTVYIQAKRYNMETRVGVEKVRELLGAIVPFARQGQNVIPVLITTSFFTPEALEFAEKTGVKTIDGEQMAYWIAKKRLGISKDVEGNLLFCEDLLLRYIKTRFKNLER